MERLLLTFHHDEESSPTPATGIPSTSPQLSVISFAPSNNVASGIPKDVLLTEVYDNNTIMANYWDSTQLQWDGNNPISVGGHTLTNVSAVSLTSDLKAYLLTNKNERKRPLVSIRCGLPSFASKRDHQSFSGATANRGRVTSERIHD